jgi:hypothetical protein
MSPEKKHKLEAAQRTLKATDQKIERMMRELEYLFESRDLLKQCIEHINAKEAKAIADNTLLPKKA